MSDEILSSYANASTMPRSYMDVPEYTRDNSSLYRSWLEHEAMREYAAKDNKEQIYIIKNDWAARTLQSEFGVGSVLYTKVRKPGDDRFNYPTQKRELPRQIAEIAPKNRPAKGRFGDI